MKRSAGIFSYEAAIQNCCVSGRELKSCLPDTLDKLGHLEVTTNVYATGLPLSMLYLQLPATFLASHLFSSAPDLRPSAMKSRVWVTMGVLGFSVPVYLCGFSSRSK